MGNRGAIGLELDVSKDVFFVTVKVKGKREVKAYDELESLVGRVKEYLKGGVKTEEIDMFTVEVKEDKKFEIKAVPWSIIAAHFAQEL